MWKQSWRWLALRRKKKKTLAINELEPNASQEKCYICKKSLKANTLMIKKIIAKLEIIAILQENWEALCIAYVI